MGVTRVGDRHGLPDGSVVEVLDASDAAQAKRFLSAVASEQGWCPPDGALGAFAQHSAYFVHSVDGAVQGAAKLVRGNQADGLPILEVWPELQLIGRVEIAELSVLALARKSRGSESSFLPLAAEVWRYCYRRGIIDLWAELEPRLVAVYGRFGWPFEPAGELREYWGDLLYPCRMSLAGAGASFIDHAVGSDRYAAAVEQALRE